jgi:hypothetical protein
MENSSVFIEQAEYIAPADFLEWSSDHPNEDAILKKLTQSGGCAGCQETRARLYRHRFIDTARNRPYASAHC